MSQPEGHAEHHDPHLAHHFKTKDQQLAAAKLGMWLFLATEIVMFSGLFCAYAVYRNLHPEIFIIGAQYLDTSWGAINTVVLLISSFTVAWGVRAAQLGQKTILVACLAATVAGGFGFMGIKYVEYSHKFHLGLGPGDMYAPVDELVQPPDAEPGPSASGEPRFTREQLTTARPFFGIYYLLTGLHGIHVIIGIGLMLWLMVRAMKGQFGPEYFTPVDLGGLYWHLVDLVWIYLFPLLYLID